MVGVRDFFRGPLPGLNQRVDTDRPNASSAESWGGLRYCTAEGYIGL